MFATHKMIQRLHFLVKLRKFYKFQKFYKLNESLMIADESEEGCNSFWLLAISHMFLIKS